MNVLAEYSDVYIHIDSSVNEELFKGKRRRLQISDLYLGSIGSATVGVGRK